MRPRLRQPTLVDHRPQLVEPGQIPRRVVRGSGVERARRGPPVAGVLIQFAHEPRRVAGVRQGVEHVGHRREMLPVPAIIDLEAAEVHVRSPLPHPFLGERQKRLGIVVPAARAFGIDAPRPWAQSAVQLAAGFGQRERGKDVGRHPAFGGGLQRGLLANRGIGFGPIVARGRGRTPPRRRDQRQQHQQKGQDRARHDALPTPFRLTRG